jgi:hypothetical protein
MKETTRPTGTPWSAGPPVVIQSKRHTTDEPAGWVAVYQFSFFSQTGVFVNSRPNSEARGTKIASAGLICLPFSIRMEERPIEFALWLPWMMLKKVTRRFVLIKN